MPARKLYLAAYDVAEPGRLQKVHKAVKQHATGGQKSVFECYLTPLEYRDLIVQARSLIDEGEDRFALLRIEERTQPLLLGIATPPVDPDFYYVG